tara:strand:- start:911 stop:1099 length:189 start_codon:yes stop_codon:yes gene_type:complete
MKTNIITIQDTMYQILGKMDVNISNEKGTEFWKERWNADSVLRNGNLFYYCRKIIDADFEDV